MIISFNITFKKPFPRPMLPKVAYDLFNLHILYLYIEDGQRLINISASNWLS